MNFDSEISRVDYFNRNHRDHEFSIFSATDCTVVKNRILTLQNPEKRHLVLINIDILVILVIAG